MGGGGDIQDDEAFARKVFELEQNSASEAEFLRNLKVLENSLEQHSSPILNSSSEQWDNHHCTICKVSLEKWIQLPNCSGDHRYCTTCAPRLVSQGKSNPWTQELTCTLCNATQKLGVQGINQFLCNRISEKGKVSFEDGNCPYHRSILVYYCGTCLEPVCYACTNGFHKGHDIETLDTALLKKNQQIELAQQEIAEKRRNAASRIERLLDKRTQIETTSQRKQEQLQKDIDEILVSLARKREELGNQISRMERVKLEALDRAVADSYLELDNCDSALNLIEQSSQNDSNPMKFLQYVCDKKEQLNSLLELEVPDHSSSFSTFFPDLPTTSLKSVVNSMRYYSH